METENKRLICERRLIREAKNRLAKGFMAYAVTHSNRENTASMSTEELDAAFADLAWVQRSLVRLKKHRKLSFKGREGYVAAIQLI